MVVGGLLFLAFAYFAVGQAAVNRNGAETAADAAALAAAQDTRNQLAGEWVQNVLDPTTWQGIFNGVTAPMTGCGRAGELAGQNDATVKVCQPQTVPLGYTVTVQTNKPVGDSIVPSTSNQYSHADATAVIESRCTFDAPVPSSSPAPTPTSTPAPGGAALPRLTCGGKIWDLDPAHLTDLPGPQDLFDVHLVHLAD
jgi:Flp pilus assembly protein TadG